MTVKEILITASTLIGREDVVNYLKEANASSQPPQESTLNTVDIMVRLLNLVVSELASTFVPMIVTERRVATNGKITYSQLSYRPIKILKAFDVVGQDRLISVEHTFARVGANTVDIEYACFPPEVTINDSLNYTEMDVTKGALAYGLLAEYAITQGCFKDAVTWHERFASAVNEHCSPKNATIKRRNWS